MLMANELGGKDWSKETGVLSRKQESLIERHDGKGCCMQDTYIVLGDHMLIMDWIPKFVT